MTTRINAVSVTTRTVFDDKKRWQDIKIKVRKDLDAHKCLVNQTGGGPTPDLQMTPWEEVAMSLMDNESLQGVGPTNHGASETEEEDRPSTSQRAVAHALPRSRQEEDGGAAVPPPPQPQPACSYTTSCTARPPSTCCSGSPCWTTS